MKKSLDLPIKVFSLSKKLPDIILAIIREAKPDEVTINPKTQEVTFRYKKEF